MFLQAALALFIIALLQNDASSSSAPTSPHEGPLLSIDEVLLIARDTANEKVGKGANKYFIDSVKYQTEFRRWRVLFEEKIETLTFDSCFKVFVDDTTKKAEFRACP
jgi:hypothetical protein